MIVAGVDSSTQETKVLIVESEEGRVLATGRARHAVTGSEGARLSDPRGWWEALREALGQTGRAGEVQALAVAGQQHGLVVLDSSGEPLAPAALWNDTTSAADAAGLVEDLGGAREGARAWAERVGSVPVASLTVSKWARLRRMQPEVARAARGVRLPHEYLTERLCGRAIGDRGDASGTGWWSPVTSAYDDEILGLERVRLDPALLSEVRTGGALAGEVTARAAAELGLAPGTVVAAGTGDNMAVAVGLGLQWGEAAMSLGTSGTVFAVCPDPVADASGVLAGFADAGEGFLPLACTLNATLAVDRVASWLGLEREAVEPAEEVVVLPYLDGERTPNLPGARGTIAGLTHTSRPGQMLQAAYEGVAESLVTGLERLEALAGPLDMDTPLLLVGGGAQGAAWRETVARLSGRELLIPEQGELATLGAAALAAASAAGAGFGTGIAPVGMAPGAAEDAAAIARRWGTREGERVAAVARDEERLARIRDVRRRLADLNAEPPV